MAENWLALRLYASSEATRLSGNAIIGNTFDVAGGGGGAGQYAFTANGRGNYWDAARSDGYDLDGDGVLDAPHAGTSPLVELALDRSGLRLFLGSPAARTLEWAERTFPVFEISTAIDSSPLARPPEVAAAGRVPAARERDGDAGTVGLTLAGALVFATGLASVAVPRWRAGR